MKINTRRPFKLLALSPLSAHLRVIATIAIFAALSVAWGMPAPAFADNGGTVAVSAGPDVTKFAKADGTLQARASTSQTYSLYFAMKPTKWAELQKFLADQQKPGNPEYRHFLTPEEFGNRFGESDEDVEAVETYLKAQGFANVTVWPNKLFVSADVNASQLQRVYGVTVDTYVRPESMRKNGEPATFIAPSSALPVPASVGRLVSNVSGLSDFFVAVPHYHVGSPVTQSVMFSSRVSEPNSIPKSNSGGWSPSSAAGNYNVDGLHAQGLTGAGQQIAIFSPTDFKVTDIDAFAKFYGYQDAYGTTTYNLIRRKINGGSSDLSGQVEACLDVEVIIGQAPNSSIYVYEGTNGLDTLAMLNSIVSDNLPVVSDSWGWTEDMIYGYSWVDTLNVIWAQMAAQGQAHYNASGDSGSTVSAGYPASNPNVTAVGGTEFVNGVEQGWYGSGGSESYFFPMPSYQLDAGLAALSITSGNPWRLVPDVAALSGSPDWDIYTVGAWYRVWGTSAAAPFWAANNVLWNQGSGTRLGLLNSKFYSLYSGTLVPTFRDIIGQTNDGYFAVAGYDMVTGLGAADMTNLYNQVRSDIPLETSISPSAGAVGTTVTLYGKHFAGTTAVAFNGTAATTYRVNSDDILTVVVPEGATSGNVSVTTPGGTASAKTFTVIDATPYLVTNLNDNGDGSLRTAIDAANLTPGSTITFQPGLTGNIMLKSVLPIIGTTMTIAGPKDATINVDGSALYGALAITAITGTVVVSDLTFRNTDTTRVINGACINITSGTVSIVRCSFGNNKSKAGAIYNTGALTVTDCYFSGGAGSAIANAGTASVTGTTMTKCSTTAVYNTGVITLTNCVISTNGVASSGYGGGLFSSGTAIVKNCQLTGNSALQGGGVLIQGMASFTNSQISGNNAGTTGATGTGGGLYVYDQASVSLDNCTLSNNFVHLGGGGAIQNNGNLTLTSCSITSNYAAGNGSSIFSGSAMANKGLATLDSCTITGNVATSYPNGGCFHNIGTIKATNCTIYNNTSGSPGGVVYNIGKLNLMNCTAYGNSPTSAYGGIYNADGLDFAGKNSSGYAMLTNTILYGDGGKEINTTAGSYSATYSDIGGTLQFGVGNTNADPLLGTLLSNGGKVQTLALGTNSPCIATGSSTWAPKYDARGYLRPATISIGAYDLGTAPPVLPIPTLKPASGKYLVDQPITITGTVEGSSFFYTTDGTLPTPLSTLYTGPIQLSTAVTVTAIATAPGYLTSGVVQNDYSIQPTTPAPMITPSGGSFTSLTTVVIWDSLAGSTIYYTTDGTDPTTASTVYTGPLVLSSSQTIKAFAVAPGYQPSKITTAKFTINLTVPVPLISPNGGSFTRPQTVTISESLEGATIYYTTDGTAPTTSSAVYSTPLDVSTTQTIRAFAVFPGYIDSGIAQSTFKITYPKPVVTGLTPSTVIVGASGFKLTIIGTDFVAKSTVTVGGTSLDATYLGEGGLTVDVPASLVAVTGSIPVVVTNPTPGGGPGKTYSLYVLNPAPTLSSLTPSNVPLGAGPLTLTVSGSGFVAATGVKVGTTVMTPTVVDSSTLTVTVPSSLTATAGPLAVLVTNPSPGGGQSDLSPLVVSNPAPTAKSISPASVGFGASGVAVTITGTGFLTNSVVTISGAELVTNFVSSTTLIAYVPSKYIEVSGTVPIVVTNHSPGGGATTPLYLAVVNPVPVIKLAQPGTVYAGAVDFDLEITGTSFMPTSAVYIGTTKLVTTYGSATHLTARVPAKFAVLAGPITVVVTNPTPGGGTSAPASITVYNLTPTITDLSPASVIAGSAAFQLTVTGVSFVNGAVVSAGGLNIPTTFVNATTLKATVPSTAIEVADPVEIAVTNPNPGGGTSVTMALPVNNPAPAISTISPSSVLLGSGGLTLTVNGSGFVSGSIVHLGSTSLVTTYVSSTKLTADIPAPYTVTAGTTQVAVTSPGPGGGSTTTLAFTVANPLPTVATIDPTTVLVGSGIAQVTLTGTGFVSGCKVMVGSTAVTTTYVSDTLVRAEVPETLTAVTGTLAVRVNNPTPGGGTSITSATLVVANPLPVATAISPATVTAGASAFLLTVTGTDFVKTSAIVVNGTTLTTTWVSATSLTATVPASVAASIGTASIWVASPTPGGGKSATVTLTVEAKPLTNPTPVLKSLDPGSVTAGAKSFTIYATGTGFMSSSVLKAGSTSLTTTYVSDTVIKATVPASIVAADGSVSFTVTNPTPGGGTSAAVALTVEPTPPAPPESAYPSYPAGLNFLSSPYDYSGVSLDTLFGYTGVKLAVWSPAAAAYAVTPSGAAGAIKLGVGYWVRLPQAVTFATLGTPAPTTKAFTIPLVAGWNQIGAPFVSAVALSKTTYGSGLTFEVASGSTKHLISSTLWAYDTSAKSYVAATSLEPLKAYWVYAFSSTTMTVPAP
ncbi:MAG TPA: IPT/TIG domain-containing protein [Capsulimonadaceae bacterium]|jgi:hypothetical protein